MYVVQFLSGLQKLQKLQKLQDLQELQKLQDLLELQELQDLHDLQELEKRQQLQQMVVAETPPARRPVWVGMAFLAGRVGGRAPRAAEGRREDEAAPAE